MTFKTPFTSYFYTVFYSVFTQDNNITPTPPSGGALLLEDGGFMLLEDGGKILLENS